MTRTATILLLASLAGAGAAIPLALAAPGDTTRISIHDNDTTQPTLLSQGAAISADGRYVAFATASQLTATPTGGKVQLYVRDRQTGSTVLASSTAAGVAADGDVDSEDSGNILYAISGDGRYVTFESVANNLVMPDTTTNQTDVFRKDLQTGAILRANESAAGVQSSQVFGDPDISYDGSRIAFTALDATVLLGFADVGGADLDVVLRDLSTNATSLISQSTSGNQAPNAPASFTDRPAISADGRFVAFEASQDANNLFPNDTNNLSDVLVRDTVAGTTTPASVSTTGTTPGAANFPDISGDGRYVVFNGPAAYDPVNSVAGQTNSFRRDMVASQTVLVSARHGITQGGETGGIRPAISADGLRIAFASGSRDLIQLATEDQNDVDSDVYVREPADLRTTRASTRTDGGQGANPSDLAAISANGGAVGFTYSDAPVASPMVAGDDNGVSDVFVKELIPSDLTGPAINVTAPLGAAQRTEASQVTVTGTVAADPSGNIETAVGGTPVARATDGSFSRTVPLVLGVNTIAITARDGAGNLSLGSVAVERVTPAVVTPQPLPVKIKASRITNLKVIAGLRTITMRFQLSRRGTIRVELKKLPKLTPARKAFVRFKRIGKNSIVMPIPRLSAGKYRVILTTTSDGGTTRITRTFVVR